MGRPAKVIDWDKVDLLLQAGCNGIEIAARFGMHYNTFYNHVSEKYKCEFSEYFQRQSSIGCSNLKYKSYEKSMKGDNHQLTLNLKNRCGYTDKQETTIMGNEDNPLSFFINQANGKSKDIVSDDKSNS